MLVLIDEDYGYQLWFWEPELTSEDPHQELMDLWEKHKPDVSCENRLENLPGKLEKIRASHLRNPWDLGVDYFASWACHDDSPIYSVDLAREVQQAMVIGEYEQ